MNFADEWLDALKDIETALKGSFGSSFFAALLTIDQQRLQTDHVLLRFSVHTSDADIKRGVEMASDILIRRKLPVMVTCDYPDWF